MAFVPRGLNARYRRLNIILGLVLAKLADSR
jgi:hypothetical protein